MVISKNHYQPGNNYKATNLGFSLIEIMMVIICISLIAGPIWKIFSSGTGASLKGLSKIDTTLEARRILAQVRKDLKGLCFDPRAGKFYLKKLQIFMETGSKAAPNYTFHSFTVSGKISNIVSKNTVNGFAPRKPSTVRYSMEPVTNRPGEFYSLVREVIPHASLNIAPIKKTLSPRIRKFFIEVYEDRYFAVRLQLVEPAKNADPQLVEAGAEGPRGVIISDYFDVVAPNVFHSIYDNSNRWANWHCTIDASLLTP